MTNRDPFLAIDWGTTNRRIFRISGEGMIDHSVSDERGVLALAPSDFAGEVADIRRRLGDLPIICAGMVGSTRGWVELPYLDCPVRIADLAEGLHWVDEGRTAIVPGVRWMDDARADVMRGEEVQFLGAVQGGLAPADALLCQPGTHCKWATMVDGAIARFSTAMTGEVFSMLQKHSLLAAQMDASARVDDDFLLGVRHGQGGDLLARLFGARADRVSGLDKISSTASYVSGLLIGSDVGSALPDASVRVHLLAGASLGALYGAAIEALGSNYTLIDSEDAFVKGIHSIWSEAQ
ncbi:2-dehydro-3-deoxygalactonokinase [Sphingobium bisphenolivorans]|uniref:2-dehydro-3-deoxygalactonokinase n=1 Tax=Sphingobium bisphenolivorans TaxID=1335760 RepID=UPI00039F65FD|nr:2-dehydro-3-deoxygalactonokinase [Sphingobium bisphenolivorans]